MEKGGQLTEKSIQWTKNLSSLPPFTHELLKLHLITDTSGKYGKPTNVSHKHNKSGLILLKYKMVILKVKIKSNVKKSEANSSLVKANYSNSCIHEKKTDMKFMFICPRKQQRFL